MTKIDWDREGKYTDAEFAAIERNPARLDSQLGTELWTFPLFIGEHYEQASAYHP